MKSKIDNIGNFIPLFNENFLKNQKIAGECVKKCLDTAEIFIKSEKNLKTKDLEFACLPIFKEFDCLPTFLNYQPKNMRPFPASICVSINNELVHGIPSERKIINGDMIKVDLGATYNGAVADAAKTFIFGERLEDLLEDLLDYPK